jgi:hypothetical protein
MLSLRYNRSNFTFDIVSRREHAPSCPKVLAALLLAVIVAVSRTSWAQTASLTGATPVAQTQDNAAAEYVRAGKLLDVRSGRVLSDQVIVIRGGRIERVANASEQQIPSGARVVDLSQATVLPGLIDCHTHIMLADTDNSHYEDYLLKDSYQYRTILAVLNVKKTWRPASRRCATSKPKARCIATSTSAMPLIRG